MGLIELSLYDRLRRLKANQADLANLEGEGRTTETVKGNADDISAIKGTGYTEGSLKTHEDRLDTLEGTGAGSVAKAIGDAVSPLAEVVDTNRLYSDSQYLALKAKADSLQVKCNTLQAEVYTDAPILQYGATEIIGKGYEADNTPIDVSANVVDGSLELEQNGLTITNLVDGADIADSGTVSFNTVNGDKYFDTLNETIITGDGTEMSSTNSSGATANMAIYHLNAHGLQTITDTAILAKLLPYVNGTKAVGKMGLRVVGRNLFTISEVNVLTYWTSAGVQVTPAVLWHKTESVLKIDSSNSASNYLARIEQEIEVLPLQNYTLRFVVSNSAYTNIGIWEFDSDGNLIAYTQKGTVAGSGTTTQTFTTTASTAYIKIGVGLFSSTSLCQFTSIMLNLGSTALPYEPYQEQLTFLPTIGNSLPNGVADSIKTVADGWEHTKRVERYVLQASDIVAIENLALGQVAYTNTNFLGFTQSYLPSSNGKVIAVGWSPSSQSAPSFVVPTSFYISTTYRLGFSVPSTTYANLAEAQAALAGTVIYYQLATPITTHYDLPLPTSGKTIHRFAGEEKIALYGTGLTFSENVLTVLSAIKFVAGVMTDITSLATITTNTVTFSGVSATDVVYVKVEHDVDRPLGILEHTPAVSNTASRLAALEAAVFGG